MKKEMKNYGAGMSAVKKAYESSVGVRALKRAGRNPNLKGIVHEIMYADKQNLKLSNILSGTKASLSKSPTAIRDDIILKNKGMIVGRMQLKDTVNSISATGKQVASGKYARTSLMGTKETVDEFKKFTAAKAAKGEKITQKMTSTGISSSDTSRIASQTLGKKIPGRDLLKSSGNTGIQGAAFSGAVELFSAGKDYFNGNISAGKAAARVAKETIGGGLSSAAGSAAGTVASAGVAAAVSASALGAVLAPPVTAVASAIAALTASCGVGTVVKKGCDAVYDKLF